MRKMWQVIPCPASRLRCPNPYKSVPSRWEEALDLLERMASEGVPPNVPAYSAAISACDKAPVPQARAALGLLERMQRDGLRGDVILYSAVMSACGKAGLWEAAEQALTLSRHLTLPPLQSVSVPPFSPYSLPHLSLPLSLIISFLSPCPLGRENHPHVASGLSYPQVKNAPPPPMVPRPAATRELLPVTVVGHIRSA